MSNKSLLPGLWTDSPFSDFRKEMDQALQGFFSGRGFGEGAVPAFRTPSIDVVEKEDSILLTAELPGLDEKDVDITLANGILTLKGEKKFEKTDEKDNYHLVERRYGSFQRAIRVPENVDEEAISARFDKGVLSVTLPKKPTATVEPRRISIGS